MFSEHLITQSWMFENSSEFSQMVYFSDFLIIQCTERNGEDSRSPPTTYCFRERVPDSLESGTNLMKQPQAPARAHQRTWLPGPPRCPWASPRCHSRSTSAWPGGGRTSAFSSFSWTGWRSRHPSCAASLAWGPPAWSGTTGTSRPWARTSGASRSSWGHLSPQGSGGRGGFEESPSSWMLRSVGLKVQPILNFAPNVLPSDMPPTMDHSLQGHVQGEQGRDHTGLLNYIRSLPGTSWVVHGLRHCTSTAGGHKFSTWSGN